MSAKTPAFHQAMRNISFKDIDVIIRNYEGSVSAYLRFVELCDAGDYDAAGEKLRDAASKIYTTFEWACKYYLDKRYGELQKEKKFSEQEADTKRAKLTSRKIGDCNLRTLISQIQLNANPSITSVGINLDIVLTNSYTVNNGPKHSAKCPSQSEYLVSLHEVQKFVLFYIAPNTVLSDISTRLNQDSEELKQLLSNCDNFSSRYSYVLICGSLSDYTNKESLLKIQWDMVVDLDSASDLTGLATSYRNTTGMVPWMRDLTKIDVSKELFDSSICHWVMACGYSDRIESVVNAYDWQSWHRKYSVNVPILIENFHRVYTKKAKVIIIPNFDKKILENIVDAFDYCYGSDIEFYSLQSEQEKVKIDYDSFHNLNANPIEVMSFLGKMLYGKTASEGYNSIYLPRDGKEKTLLQVQTFAEARDMFEIVYLDIDENDKEMEEKTNPEYYYKGISDISWYGLRKNFDISRVQKIDTIRRIQKNMEDKARVLINIQYEPGIGGTSYMRRLAWEFHQQYPTLILNKYREDDSANIVQKIYLDTKMPILVFADSNRVSPVDIEKFYSELKASGVPFSVYFIQRSNNSSSNHRSDSFGEIKRLSKIETEDMKDILEKYGTAPDFKNSLKRICASNINDDERSPFIMALYAFQNDYHGLKAYISKFLFGINRQSKKFLFDIALADFANAKIDMEFFRDFFPGAELIETYIGFDPVFSGLVKIYSINKKKYLKIRHHLFASEILKQLSDADSEVIKFSNLANYLFEFIDDSKSKTDVTNQDTIDLLRILFVTREEDENAEKPTFSPIIEMIRKEKPIYFNEYDESNDIVVRIFEKLVETFPTEAHFLAHLARYYFYISKNYVKGFEIIDKAISISKNIYATMDPILLHMKAMGYSSRITNDYIKDALSFSRAGNLDDLKTKIDDIFSDAESASELFDIARTGSKGIFGYISEIYLCTKIFNMGRILSEEKDNYIFLQKEEAYPYLQYLDRAYSLLDESRKIAREKDMEKIRELDALLESYRSRMEESITLWESYLKRTEGNNRPKIGRMLARAYQNRIEKEYGIVDTQRDVQRIIELMEENIEIEPEKTGNIRIWFSAIRKLKTNRPDDVLAESVIKLNRWVNLADSPEAHFYRFIAKFLQAYNGSRLAEQELPKLLVQMKEKTRKLFNRTITLEWLGNSGSGIDKIIDANDFKKAGKNDEQMQDQLMLIKGRISNKSYMNDAHAYISANGIDVFFSPQATNGISKMNVNQLVIFGLGFSYDGPRAFNKSIRLGVSDDTIGKLCDNHIKISIGTNVRCEIIEHKDKYTVAKIPCEEILGRIYVSDGMTLNHSTDSRPRIGQMVEVTVECKLMDHASNREYWILKMEVPINSSKKIADWQKKLMEYTVKDEPPFKQ